MNLSKNKTVILEGFHVCKHAVRFNAEITELVTADKKWLTEMLDEYAPDIKDQILEQIQEIDEEMFCAYSDIQIRTPLAGKAIIPKLEDSSLQIDKPIVLLENPRDQGNIGAVVRLSAGMDCAGVMTTGDTDPWHKNSLRGAQGLQFALPVICIDNLETRCPSGRPVYVFDESGVDLTTIEIPNNAILAFGSERHGVSNKLLERADVVVKIPQQSGVSSYNLATSVAMGVYHVKYKHG